MRTLSVKTGSLFVALWLWAGAVRADVACYPVGTAITLFGTAVREDVESSDGSVRTAWMLAMDPPLCVVDRRFSQDALGRLMVPRIQLIGVPPPPVRVPIAVTGTLSTRNAPQYFIVPSAMWVTPPRPPQPPQPPVSR
ncbi:hypothetical protein [Caballeronia sp. LZ001]|uniref:hypothetical protein n=1 Tax=Caballeronia sp. LZ001 TaxID=3038553 RepID=UPI00286554DD|nr:hypothetical protein [Caballeronia sp. LZ001]MDR5805501.1 hypothetical protein [Caballeronia sp. LZ001]